MVLEGTGRPKVRVQPVNRPDGSTDWRVNFPGIGVPINDTKDKAVKEGRKIARERSGQLLIYDSSNSLQKQHDYS